MNTTEWRKIAEKVKENAALFLTIDACVRPTNVIVPVDELLTFLAVIEAA